MADKKVVYSTNIGGPWQSSVKPDSRRKVNLKKNTKKGNK